ncbi:MAG: DNA adenine methylase [Paraburkholderia sp.]|uniref:DNA adenine methylase n=1 Tax=Paraburkholderia sp. TaxID=1926495 RepID=UPI00122C073C|nr:DNA adenine methylase [Paraburkholderia sp.]TAM01112.1 MAG: DNA adenine methylase [Paraburkholderia sp.]TAM30386.1 MAG: DNA adenine methylase [Paraburkholderia sp.]
MANCTPLRYPGGKARLRPYLERLIEQNHLYDAHYVEPFCGGAGLALELLMNYTVSTIHINDLDRAVYAFWYSATRRTDALCTRIGDTPCSIDTWHEQRAVWVNRAKSNLLDLAFATFFLNRTNRSGILDAGVIGGKNQTGRWKLDARYNRDRLIERIEAIGRFRSRIHVYNQEAVEFLKALQPDLPRKSLIYLDPPYVEKGPGLYLNHYGEEDHRSLAKWVATKLRRPWMVSYDAHPLIRECYGGHTEGEMNFHYSAHGNARRGTELVYFSEGLVPPDMSHRSSRYHQPWEAYEAA